MANYTLNFTTNTNLYGPNITRDITATGGFSKYFESTTLTYTFNASSAIAHNLKVKPKLIQFALSALVNDYQFQLGDDILVNHYTPSQNNVGIFVWANSSQIKFRVNGAAYVSNSQGTNVSLHQNKWTIFLRAWA